MSDEVPEANPLRDHAAMILQITREAKKLERKLQAEAVIVIGVFKDGHTLRFQDAGRFVMPPDQFYDLMVQAHQNGQLGMDAPKLKPTSKIIKPH